MACDSREQYPTYTTIFSPIPHTQPSLPIHYKGRFREQNSSNVIVISASFGPKHVAQILDIPTYSNLHIVIM